MTYKKLGPCYYVEVKEKAKEKEVAEDLQILYKTTICAKEFGLFADGFVKTKGVCGNILKVAMKPWDEKVFMHVDGAYELLARIVRSNKLSQSEKFEMMKVVQPEYFTPQLVAEIQFRYFGRESALSQKECNWFALVDSKEKEYSKMVVKAEESRRSTFELIAKIKGEPQTI